MVGRLGAIVALLVGIVSLVTTCFGPRGRLVGYVTFSDFGYPPTADATIQAVARTVQKDLLADWRKNGLPIAGGAKQLADDPNLLAERFKQNILFAAMAGGAIFTIEVTNVGNSTLRNVRLHPHASVLSAVVERPDRDPEVLLSRLERRTANQTGDILVVRGDYLDVIALGDMPAGTQIRVRGWAADPGHIGWFGRWMKLTHDAGTGRVFAPVYWLTADEWLRRTWVGHPWLVSVFGLGVIGVAAAWFYRRQQR